MEKTPLKHLVNSSVLSAFMLTACATNTHSPPLSSDDNVSNHMPSFEFSQQVCAQVDAIKAGEAHPALTALWQDTQRFANVANIDMATRFSPGLRVCYDPDLVERLRCSYKINAAFSYSKNRIRVNPEGNHLFVALTFLVHEFRHGLNGQKAYQGVLNAYMEDVNIPEEERVMMAAFLEADARAYTIWWAYKLRNDIPGYWERFKERHGYEDGANILENTPRDPLMSDEEFMASVWNDVVMVYMLRDYSLTSAMRKVNKDIHIDGEITAFDPMQPADTLFTPEAFAAMGALGQKVFEGVSLYDREASERFFSSFSRQNYLDAHQVYLAAQEHGAEFCSIDPEYYQLKPTHVVARMNLDTALPP